MSYPSSTEPQPVPSQRWPNQPTLMVDIQLFAAAAERAGCRQVQLVLPRPASLKDLERSLITDFPALESLLSSSRWAANCEFVAEDYLFYDNANVAMIPPVSGG